MSKTSRRLLTVGILVLIIALLAWPKLRSDDGEASAAAPAFAGNRALSVSTYVVQPETIRDRILVAGSVLANEAVALQTEAAGKITEIAFQEGRRVAEGDLLVKINDAELQAQLVQAQYRQRLAEDREARQKALLDKGGISREEYDATLNEVNVLRAATALTEAQIAKTELRAPFSGVIGLRNVSVGSFVNTSTEIATLQDLGSVRVEFSIPERYANRLQVGDTIYYVVEGQDGTFSGRIYAFEPRIEAGTRTLRVRARSSNTDGRLLPGAFANIELVFEEITDALAVPTIAIIPELGGKRLYLLQNGKAMPRPVETGIRLDDRVQVTTGIAPGDTVITSGIQQLRPGLDVAPRAEREGGL